MIKKIGVAGVAIFCILSFSAQAEASAQQASQGPKQLNKDQSDACQAKLCLASAGIAYQACAAPLKKYYNIRSKKRARFLNKCPKA